MKGTKKIINSSAIDFSHPIKLTKRFCFYRVVPVNLQKDFVPLFI